MAPATLGAPPPSPADLAIVNGRIWTADPQCPAADTIVIRGDRILAIGDRTVLQALQPQPSRIIDAGGRRIIPGLIDSHLHLLSGGLQLSQLQLREASSRQDFIARVRRHAAALPPDAWVLGRGWSVESWADASEPTAAWIDDVCGSRPAMLSRMDGHQALANSEALRRAGITRSTPDPPGGEIVRDAGSGVATGILKDAAMDLVSHLIPDPDSSREDAALREAMKLLNRFGVTTVHTMADARDPAVFQRFAAQRRLTLRVYWFAQNDWSVQPAARGDLAQDMLRWAGYKAYFDGSLGSRTAYMQQPYSDLPEHDAQDRGLLTAFAMSGEVLPRFRRAADRQAQLAVHAIGDQANHLLIDHYQALLADHPQARPRIEHAQHLLPEDIARFGGLGIIASMQPLHKADDGRYAEQRLGSRRCRTSYAFKDLLDADAVVCFGSDWPVVSPNPLLGVHAAVTGRTLSGTRFMPHQNISVEQALHCYTTRAAYACFMEDQMGMLRKGMLADVVILEQDPLTIAPADLADVTVHTTIVGGQMVWSATAGQ